MNSRNLSGKVAIVTGSGRGIGAATALILAQNGADIVVNDLSGENAANVAKEIEKLGRRVHVSTHDVSQLGQAATLVAEAIAQLGSVDILVNNAGIIRDAMVHKMTEEQWDDVIRVNLKGPFNMSQASARAMIERKKGGRIINLASTSWLGNVGQTNYSASKAGVVGMTKTLALELARHGVTVNAIAPGFIDTVMTQAVPSEVKEKIIAKIPLKRMGKPEDIAAAIAFLASDEAAYLTGQCIEVDGGLTVGTAH